MLIMDKTGIKIAFPQKIDETRSNQNYHAWFHENENIRGQFQWGFQMRKILRSAVVLSPYFSRLGYVRKLSTQAKHEISLRH